MQRTRHESFENDNTSSMLFLFILLNIDLKSPGRNSRDSFLWPARPPRLSVASGELESTFLPARIDSSNPVFAGPRAANFWNRSQPRRGTGRLDNLPLTYRSEGLIRAYENHWFPLMPAIKPVFFWGGGYVRLGLVVQSWDKTGIDSWTWQFCWWPFLGWWKREDVNSRVGFWWSSNVWESKGHELNHLVVVFSTTCLRNMLSCWIIFHRLQGKNRWYLKPPPRNVAAKKKQWSFWGFWQQIGPVSY